MARSAVFPHFAYDNLLLLKDAGAITASAAAQVGGADRILDMGASAYHFGQVVIEVTAIETDTNNESYRISLQGSASATFASGIYDLGSLLLGGSSVAPQGAASVVGQYMFPFSTEVVGTTFRYLRLYTTIAGTIVSGINYKAFLSPQIA